MQKNSIENQLNQEERSQKQEERQVELEQQQKQLEGEGQVTLSKKQLKRMKKKQKWHEIKMIKREKQKERKKKKRQQKAEQRQKQQKMEQKIQQKQQQKAQKKIMKKRKDDYRQKMLDNQVVVIDLQFYDEMTEKQQISLGKQLAYCHSINRKLQRPFNYVISSLTQSRYNFISEKYQANNWGITLKNQHLLDLFPSQKVVYLTGDAQEQLTQFNPEDVYVIGGIVDHNRLRNITINYANQNKIRARRLPMEGLKLKASVHLAVNHVWEWMLRFYNGSTWKESIKTVIPERKLQQVQKNK